MRFRNWLGMMRVGGNTISLISLYKNCDISPITKKSSRLVSQCDLLAYSYMILLRVISKGRDKIVEIESNELLSRL